MKDDKSNRSSKHKLNPISNIVKEFKQNLPRCSKCDQLLTVSCDRSKPSEFVEWLGMGWTKKKPQRMWMFPTAEDQSKLCYYCENRLYPIKIGKES